MFNQNNTLTCLLNIYRSIRVITIEKYFSFV